MEPQSRPHPHSLLGLLAHLPAPRRRQGRLDPLSGMRGMLIVAA